MDYIITQTDVTTNGQFTIRPYTTDGPVSPANATPLAPYAVSANTSLILLGDEMFDGESIASNFVHLLENFSNNTAPVYPIQGQLWYKNDTQELFLYDSESFDTQQLLINGKLTSALNVNTYRIMNVGTPTSDNDAVTKSYVESNFLTSSGELNITGTLTIQTGAKLLLIDSPINDTDGTNKLYVDTANTATRDWTTSNFVNSIGDTITGNLILTSDNYIILNSAPSNALHATNKLYVDNAVLSGGTGFFVKKQGDTIAGPMIIDGTGTGGGLTITNIVTGEGGTITVNGGDYTSMFTTGVPFYVIGNTGIAESATFTVESSIFSDGNTIITVTNNISNDATNDGTIVGSAFFNSSPIFIDAPLTISGVHILDFGSNKLTNIDDPINATDAATKQYIDTAISGIGGGVSDGYLSGGTFNSNTNTITLTSTSNVPDVNITGIANILHTHDTNQLYHSVYAPLSQNSRLRQTLFLSSTYPYIEMETIINQVDTDLAYLCHRNDRFITPVNNIPVIGVSTALTGNLNIIGFSLSTYGHQYVNFSDLTSGNNSTNLATITTAGYQIINVGGAKIGGDTTGLTNNISATNGYQIINVGGAKIGGDTTGLTNDTTIYTASISIDGTSNVVSVVGSAAQTITELITEINTDLTGATAALVDGNIKIISSLTGVASIIAITDTDLFSTLTGYVAILTAVNGINTISTTYTATITVDGVANPISIIGGNAQTFTELITEINTDLTGATATLIDGNIKITSATTGITSTITITDTDLFSTLTGYVAILTAVTGVNAINAPYTATITVDGVANPISIIGGNAQTFTELITEINTDLTGATATLVDGNIKITSATTGITSIIAITDTNLFSNLTGYVAIIANVLGTCNAYTTTITVDGEAKPISIISSAAQTFTTLISAINNELGNSAFATLDIPNKRIIITSATYGPTSTILIVQGTLFIAPLANFTNISSAVGGIPNTFTVAGDHTTTFIPSTIFEVAGNVFSSTNITYTTVSSSYGTNTIITVTPTIPIGTTISGHINRLYGILKIAGNKTDIINAGSRINLSGNSSGNGNYYISYSNEYANNTYLYIDNTTPLPLGTTADGNIQQYTYILPFNILIENNKLQVFNNGIKQYTHTRGQSILKFGIDVNENTDTKLINDSYSFNIAIDGGSNILIPIVVNQTIRSISAVNPTNHTWTVPTLIGSFFYINSVFCVSGNTGLGIPVYYTVKSVVDNGTIVVITVKEAISNSATANGTIQYPYTISKLIQNINTEFITLAPKAKAIFENNNIIIFSTTNGSSSQITITDIDLISTLNSKLGTSILVTASIGVNYAYSEIGIPLLTGNLIEFASLPTIGNVIECINTR